MTWEERVKRAQETGSFTAEDLALSASWGTCAMSEHDVPSGFMHVPTDDVLSALGVTFCGMVERGLPDKARRVLGYINIRVKELQQNELARTNS